METTNVVSNPGFSAFKLESSISFIRPYDPKAASITGYRHAIIRYRDTSKGVSIKPAQMCTIPELSLPDDYSLLPDKAVAVLKGVICDEQDAIIKQAIEDKKSIISWSDVSLDACLDSLTATRVSQRLTLEQINAWVRVAMVATIRQRAEQKLSEGAKDYQGKTLDQAFAILMNAYAEKYSKLSAPVPNLGMETATMLHNQLLTSELDDDIAKALRAKLHAILNPIKDSSDL